MTNLAHILLENSQRDSQSVAVILQHAGQDDVSLTYADLFDNASRYAQAYAQAGLRKGEVVILILQHGVDLVYAFFGALLGGMIPSIMPFLTEKLSPERYRADLAALIGITRPASIVTYPEFETEARAALQDGGSVRAVISTAALPSRLSPDLSLLLGLECSPDDIVLLQHSSGTTGLQKGVALSHRAVLNQLDAYGQSLSLDADDVVVSWLPLYHDMGLIAGFLMPILKNIKLVLISPFDWVRAPYRLMQAVSQYRGTLSWLPNFAYNFCAQKIRDRQLEGVDLSTWRAVINCSEPVRWESHRLFYEKFKSYGLRPAALQTCYAMAENVFGVAQSALGCEPVVEEIDSEAYLTERIARLPVDGRPALKMMSSGRAIPNTQVRIVDEKHKDVPDRTIGEIALRSTCMLTGYYNRPDATQKAFSGGWYLTGDYGYMVDGELFVSGRKKDMIIVGGKNIYPQDLESLASQVPGVHPGRVVAFGIYNDEAGTEDVVIIAEVDTNDPQERQQISDAIRQTVTRNSAIALRNVYLVSSPWIIKTSSGKTARSANREKYLQEVSGS